MKDKQGYTIALAGNPNVGKSTIFNALTGMHQHTGNWTGKTVSNATGICSYRDTNFFFVDIPGTYSIMSDSEEEEIARDYICFGNPDATVVVVDSTCLERNMNLVFQIMEITNNVIVCVNLLDEAKKKKIKIDLDKLSKKLGVPVVGTIARKKKTLNNLMNTVKKVCKKEIEPKPIKVKYSNLIEDNIKVLKEKLKYSFINVKGKEEDKEESNDAKSINYSEKINNNKKLDEDALRWISLKVLDGEEKILKTIEKNYNINIINNIELQKERNKLFKDLEKEGINEKNLKDKIVSRIMSKAEEICKEVCTFENENYSNRDRKIDKIVTSKKWGIPIMILFLGIIFWITIIGANYPSQALFAMFGWIQERLFEFANFINCPTWLSDMLISGIYQTLSWVIAVMLPPMAIFFPLFTFLEDLGYLPRIAFNMDGLFKKCCCTR